MKALLKWSACSLAALFVVGCTGMIPVHNLNQQPVQRGLSLETVREAIEQGAQEAGWRTKRVSSGEVRATYRIRAHTVVVAITYDERIYNIDYLHSRRMKVRCPGDGPNQAARVTRGRPVCANGVMPELIHGNYKAWIEELNWSIYTAMGTV